MRADSHKKQNAIMNTDLKTETMTGEVQYPIILTLGHYSIIQ